MYPSASEFYSGQPVNNFHVQPVLRATGQKSKVTALEIYLMSFRVVNGIKELLFTTPLAELKKTRKEYQKRCPGSLNKIFPDKLPKEEAILQHQQRKNIQTELQPAGK